MAKQDGGGDVVLDNRLLKQDLGVFCFELKGKLLSIGPPKNALRQCRKIGRTGMVCKNRSDLQVS